MVNVIVCNGIIKQLLLRQVRPTYLLIKILNIYCSLKNSIFNVQRIIIILLLLLLFYKRANVLQRCTTESMLNIV